ncbi:polysaccharide export protein EpsE [Ideonella sp. B7]|uniref:polysaccharide export protein EpsE n=1 Tax=Ideonella benzenivorans TaxID=2831643 RepID=UPI002873D0F1|nr:polysaccharide export protein EpsE [Ideonella benzenivorans]MCA6218224.1 polysaccharide export protein EpsE [Ideonella benzenivorans]
MSNAVTSVPARPARPSRRWPPALLLSLALLGAGGLPFPSAQAAGAPDLSQAVEYKLGPGDQLRIQVYQSDDLTLETRLSDRGVLSYPLLGHLQLGGRTLLEAEALIADGLRKGQYVKDPQVTVVLLQVRGNQVNVLGQVAKPGRYPLEAGVNRLSDLLATAGGITPLTGSDIVTVVGQRGGKPFRKLIDLPQVFSSPDASDDLVLAANDVVYVDRAPVIYIYGEVQKPGQLRLERGMTLLQGLAAGGGLTLRGTERGIQVQRRAAQGKVEMLQPDMQAPLQDGDVIYVRESIF